MTQKEYAKYLSTLVNDKTSIHNDDLAFQFYGYFQSFMPNGENLKKVFEPIKYGNEFYSRVIQAFKVTKNNFNELSNKGLIPGYFCPSEKLDNSKLIENGELFINNLLQFSKQIENKELIHVMDSIKTVVVNESEKTDKLNNTNILIYEIIGDWYGDNTDYSLNIEILSEAFYSIACDYYLSYYFQHPRYKNKLKNDIFKPYFEIWKSGSTCWFEDNKLVIQTIDTI